MKFVSGFGMGLSLLAALMSTANLIFGIPTKETVIFVASVLSLAGVGLLCSLQED